MSKDGIALLSLFKNRQNTLFDVGRSMFDVRCSRESQAHCAQSLYTNGAVQLNQILPVRVRSRTEIAARTRSAGYVASAVR